MADSGSSTSPAEKHKKSTSSSFFNSPRLFTNLSTKGLNETETMMSPTSILDSKPFSGLKNPFWSESNSPRTPVGEHKRCWEIVESKGVGLVGLVDALVDEKHGEVNSKPESRMVLFGSQLRIQVPPLGSPLPPTTISSAEFGIKMGNSQLDSSSGSFSMSPMGKSPPGCANSHPVFTGCLSASEIELSEDYTRVISHGPNPRTTHIFDNCIIESSCFEFDSGSCSASSAKENGFFPHHTSYCPSESFLSNCFYCKKNLDQGKDIYMYRGEWAFCSNECRYQGMLLEEGMSKLEAEDFYMT